MKKVAFFTIFALLISVIPALAQANSELMLLNDATPTVDVAINLPENTTGAISLKLAQAAAILKDSTGRIVFAAADPRLHGVEFNIAPNTGNYILTLERLAGVPEAYASIVSAPEMNLKGVVTPVTEPAVTLNQEVALSLDQAASSSSAVINIPQGYIGLMSATFPGVSANAEVVDSGGTIIAKSVDGRVDGISLLLDTGRYGFLIAGSKLSHLVVANVRLVSAQDAGLTILAAPTTPEVISDTALKTCEATVVANSVNLRSGPGTGYSVLGYAYRGNTFTVGGENPENNWILVGTGNESAWVSLENAQLAGACSPLTIFNVPLLDATSKQNIITSQQPSNNYDDDHEHEDHDD